MREQVPFSLAYPDALISKTLQLIVIRFMEHRVEEIHAHDQTAKKFFNETKKYFFRKGVINWTFYIKASY
ncbi:hypothetical protein OL548_12690 [Lysinibacillus sp. MHQ-1]|nr:hypothetical protein OL548_12690 [Lysinibacillus sp. MHQ-1]